LRAAALAPPPATSTQPHEDDATAAIDLLACLPDIFAVSRARAEPTATPITFTTTIAALAAATRACTCHGSSTATAEDGRHQAPSLAGDAATASGRRRAPAPHAALRASLALCLGHPALKQVAGQMLESICSQACEELASFLAAQLLGPVGEKRGGGSSGSSGSSGGAATMKARWEVLGDLACMGAGWAQAKAVSLARKQAKSWLTKALKTAVLRRLALGEVGSLTHGAAPAVPAEPGPGPTARGGAP
jgi:hypothetical protein